MAYSTNNSLSTISVTNFGAKLDGITDNKNALQNAINYTIANRGGTLFFPKGDFYWSGTVHVTGQNINFLGEAGSVLRSAIDESAKKINISGAKNIYFNNLTIDGGKRTRETNDSNQLGFISTINSENIRISNCSLYNTFNSLIYLGGGTRFVNISNNYFTGHFCGIYSYVNDGESTSECFTIDSNRFGDSWCSGSVGESACIKLQAYWGHPSVTRGHVVTNNTIDSRMQMAIELWSRGRNNTVSNNSIENTVWGISLDGQEDCTVSNNTIKNVPYAGIELASACKRNVINGNNINGYYTTGAIDQFRNTDYGLVLSNTACEDNVLSNNIIIGPSYGALVQNAKNTTICNNIFKDCDQGINFQAASLAKVHGNLFSTGKFLTNYHIFFDASNVSLSGFHFSQNKFVGRTAQQSIFYYNNGNPYTVKDVCFENNFTDPTTLGGYDIFIGGQFTPANYVYRNNFGPSGANGSNSIQDASDSSSYTTTDIKNGYSYYGGYNFVVPSGGCTGNGLWVCVWSGGGGEQNNVRISMENYYTSAGVYDSLEIAATMFPYGGSYRYDSLTVSPGVTWNTPSIFKEVKTWGNDSLAQSAVWVRIGSIASGAVGALIPIKYSKANLLSAPVHTYTQVVDTSNNNRIYLDDQRDSSTQVTERFSNGISVGSSPSRIYSAQSGVVNISGLVAIATNEQPHAPLSFGKRIDNTIVALYDDTVGPTIYGMGISPYTFRFHVDQAASRFSFFDAPAGNEIFTVKASGYVGVNNPHPTRPLDVVGPLGKVATQPAWGTTDTAVFENNGNTAISLLSSHGSSQAYYFSNPSVKNAASIGYDFQNKLTIAASTGRSILAIDGFGKIYTSGYGTNTSATATAGGATLPANPLGFLIVNITGIDCKIPYYAV